MTEEAAANVTPDVGALAEQVRRVAALRRSVAALDGALFAHRRNYEDSVAGLNAEKDVAGHELRAAEDVVRALALTRYHATKDKTPTAGVVVKEYELLDYDADAAFAWARATKLAVIPEALDRRAFEKIAKATPLEFVTVIVEPRVRIATDLDKALDLAPVSA